MTRKRKHAPLPLLGARLYENIADVEWDFTVSEYDARLARCVAVQKQPAEEWRADALKRVEEIGRLVTADKQQAALAKLEVEAEVRRRSDAKETAALMKRWADAVAKVADKALKERWARVNAVTKQMDAEVVAAERKRFNVRGRRR
jgi:hypothetical protein